MSSFSSILKFIKNNYYDRYWDVLHQVARIIRHCWFEKLFFTVISIFSVIVFKRALNLSWTKYTLCVYFDYINGSFLNNFLSYFGALRCILQLSESNVIWNTQQLTGTQTGRKSVFADKYRQHPVIRWKLDWLRNQWYNYFGKPIEVSVTRKGEKQYLITDTVRIQCAITKASLSSER